MGIITAYPDKTPAEDGDKYLTVAEDGSTRLTTLDTMRDGVLAPGSVDSDTLAQSAKPQFKVGNFLAGGSTGNFSVTGVGFKPKLVEFTWILPTSSNMNAASGKMDATGSQFATTAYVTSGATVVSTQGAADKCFMTPGSSGTTREAEFVSMDDDGFTINFTKAASNTEIGYVAYA